MSSLTMQLIISALLLFFVSKIVPGFRMKGFPTAMLCAIVLWGVGIVAFILTPIIMIPVLVVLIPAAALTGPFAVIPAMLMLLGLQAVMFVIADKMIEDFEIDGWGYAFLASFVYTLLQTGLKFLEVL